MLIINFFVGRSFTSTPKSRKRERIIKDFLESVSNGKHTPKKNEPSFFLNGEF